MVLYLHLSPAAPSICLPMEGGSGVSQAYLVGLLVTNGLAFVVITGCYASMYCSIR